MRQLLTEAPSAATHARKPKARYYELDWLRIFVVLALVPAHTLGFFTSVAGQFLGAGDTGPLDLAALVTLGDFGIALLFLVAGASTGFALDRRSTYQFAGERCVRLLVPFAFASLTLIPLQDYFVVRAFPAVLGHMSLPSGWEPHPSDSPLVFYWGYLGAYASFLTHYAQQYEIVFWGQLWFLPRLLVISLLTLPLLLFLRRERGKRLVGRLAINCERYRGAVYLLALPLGLVLAVIGWQWQVWQVVSVPDAANVLAQMVFYAIVYVYGYVLYADRRLRLVVRRDGGVMALALAVFAFLLTQIPGFGDQAVTHDYSAGGIAVAFIRALAAWLCVLGITGLAMRFLAVTNWAGRYLNEASYPFYVLHLTVLYLVGLPLLTGESYPILRYLAMIALTYAVTFGVYELAVRRIPPVRVLFGMRRRRRPVPA